jgi:hypothetical protein
MNQIIKDSSLKIDAAESLNFHENIESKQELEEIK